MVYTIESYDADGQGSGMAISTADDLVRMNVKGIKNSNTKTLAGAAVWIRSLADMLKIGHQVKPSEVFKAMAWLRDAARLLPGSAARRLVSSN